MKNVIKTKKISGYFLRVLSFCKFTIKRKTLMAERADYGQKLNNIIRFDVRNSRITFKPNKRMNHNALCGNVLFIILTLI